MKNEVTTTRRTQINLTKNRFAQYFRGQQKQYSNDKINDSIELILLLTKKKTKKKNRVNGKIMIHTFL